MAKNRPAERLRQLRKAPLYKVSESGIDWYNHPQRADIANRLSWIGYSPHDKPIHEAMNFFGLQPQDPRHVRICLTYLAMAFFPNAKSGTRGATLEGNALLLKRSREVRNARNDTEILKALVKKYPEYKPKPGGKSTIPALRKRLNAARLEEARFG